MSVFDKAWDIAKDFYFDTDNTMKDVKRRDDGSILSFSDTLGNMQPPVVEGDYMSRINRGSNYKPVPLPFVEGKHQPVILPRRFCTKTYRLHEIKRYV